VGSTLESLAMLREKNMEVEIARHKRVYHGRRNTSHPARR
jgi:hypothetical protein